MNFPNDFNKIAHPVCSGAIQFKPKKEQPVFISIVGGEMGLYGDGEKTFELMIGDKVHGYLSTNEVNEKINEVLDLITM